MNCPHCGYQWDVLTPKERKAAEILQQKLMRDRAVLPSTDAKLGFRKITTGFSTAKLVKRAANKRERA